MWKSAKRGELGTPQIFLLCVTLWASGSGASQKEKRKLIGDQTRARWDRYERAAPTARLKYRFCVGSGCVGMRRA
jgi:hypothetical protein